MTETQLEDANRSFRKAQQDEFLLIFKEEGDNQWDRIMDRRTTNFIYGVIVNLCFVIVGFVLGRIL